MYSIVNNIRAKVTHAGSNSSFHDFLASRLPKTKTPNQKHGHVFEAILQLVPETGTPHTTPPPHHWNVEILGSFFSQKLFFGLLFSLLPYCLSQKRKSYTPRKLIWNLINGFQKEYPFPRNPPHFQIPAVRFLGDSTCSFWFCWEPPPTWKCPIPGRWTVVWVVTFNISIIAAQSLHQ